MPHRRSRKASAVFMCSVMTLFLWQGSVYPAHGYVSSAAAQAAQGKESSGSSLFGAITAFSLRQERPEMLRLIVRQGETVWEIAHKYQTTVADIVQLNRLTDPDQIKPGQGIWIISSTLKENSKENNSSLDKTTGNKSIVEEADEDKSTGLTNANKMPGEGTAAVTVETDQTPESKSTQVIDVWVDNEPGNNPSTKTVSTGTAAENSNASRGEHSTAISQEDLDLMARVIYAEARGENFDGQVAVGAVVLNRLKDPRFPKTIHDVIYQPGAFTAVMDQQIHLSPDNLAYDAARAALSGVDPTGGAVYYYNPRLATDRWIKSRPVVKRIGNHTFSI